MTHQFDLPLSERVATKMISGARALLTPDNPKLSGVRGRVYTEFTAHCPTDPVSLEWLKAWAQRVEQVQWLLDNCGDVFTVRFLNAKREVAPANRCLRIAFDNTPEGMKQASLYKLLWSA